MIFREKHNIKRYSALEVLGAIKKCSDILVLKRCLESYFLVEDKTPIARELLNEALPRYEREVPEELKEMLRIDSEFQLDVDSLRKKTYNMLFRKK